MTAAAQDDLHELSLEELMEFQITSVSKKPESLAEAAAAVYVLTGEDIRRAGATSLPEALRLVPGLMVARVDAHTWALSSRGFSSTTANKLEVLLDGRSLYTPLFSGVFWDVQDTFLEDVDRIEVIRGPGATLWGANAVNGVINILTRGARETEGSVVIVGGGSEDRGYASARHGMKVGDDAYLRVYGKYWNRDDSELPSGTEAVDQSRMVRAGFRYDRGEPDGDRLTFQGDVYRGRTQTDNPLRSLGSIAPADNELEGGNLLARWSFPRDAGEDQLQVYYDRTTRDLPGVFSEDRDIFDLDYQQRRTRGERHEVVWGVSYRLSSDDVDNTNLLSWTPSARDLETFGAFVQDEVSFKGDRLRLTFGSKFEHNDYTGFEVQPSFRWLYKLDDSQVLWGALSRAVRSPSRLDRDIRFDIASGNPSTSFALLGSDGFESEVLLASEVGYRARPRPTVSVDLALFYNDYDRLASIEGPGNPFFEGGRLVLPFEFDNRLTGESYGSELALLWQPVPRWRIHASWTWFELDLRAEPGSTDTTSMDAEGNDPQHQLAVRSTLDLSADWAFDAVARWVDALPNLGAGDYLDVDLRLGYKPTDGWTLSIVGQNLLDERRVEWGSQATAVERGVYGEIRWAF